MAERNQFTSLRTTKINGARTKQFLKYFKYPEIPNSINDIYVITTVGDRLDTLANEFYNNVDYWWIIATANPNVIRRDSYSIKPGTEIRIPENPEGIIETFEKIN